MKKRMDDSALRLNIIPVIISTVSISFIILGFATYSSSFIGIINSSIVYMAFAFATIIIGINLLNRIISEDSKIKIMRLISSKYNPANLINNKMIDELVPVELFENVSMPNVWDRRTLRKQRRRKLINRY
jgi:hypothetical protein